MAATAWLMFLYCVRICFVHRALQVSPKKIVAGCKVRRTWQPQIFAKCLFLREDLMDSLQGYLRSVACRPVLLEEEALSFLFSVLSTELIKNVRADFRVDCTVKKYQSSDVRP
jgi:hypothetical protein